MFLSWPAILVPGTAAIFCQSTLYTDTFVCEDGSSVKENGCCTATDRCPSSCMSSGWSTRNGVTSCTCANCNYGSKLSLSQDERYLKATNYFRCRHGHPLLAWDPTMATQSQQWADTCPSQGSNPPHSDSYSLTPSSGQNVAAGQKSPENAVEDWYSEITSPGYTPGGKGGPGVGHYTALIWKTTAKLGCGQTACASGSPAPVHVCHYAEQPPNFGGDADYVSNVPQSNTPTATEETCCQNVYGGSSSGSTATSGGTNSNGGSGFAGSSSSVTYSTHTVSTNTVSTNTASTNTGGTSGLGLGIVAGSSRKGLACCWFVLWLWAWYYDVEIWNAGGL